MTSERVYICHTFYHAYIACVKELAAASSVGPADGKKKSAARRNGTADIILSTMSNDFGELPERLEKCGLFGRVLMFDEQSGADNEKIQKLHRDRGNILLNLLQRIKYTKALGKLQEGYVPTDLSVYRDVYVFCDSDPIGYYLNYKKIPYHALEDGLNSGKLDDQARLSNQGAWKLKVIMAALGLIFIESGYSKYCIDYEVNDRSANYDPPENCIEVPRRPLVDSLSKEDHRLLADLFLPDAKAARKMMRGFKRPVAMILTEPLCALDVREKLFGDIISEYAADYDIVIKPHPRDLLDYQAAFADKYPGIGILTGRFPMEVLDDIPEFRIKKLVSVITQVDDVRFAESTDYLGLDFLDKYEDPTIHRKMERLTGIKTKETTALCESVAAAETDTAAVKAEAYAASVTSGDSDLQDDVKTDATIGETSDDNNGGSEAVSSTNELASEPGGETNAEAKPETQAFSIRPATYDDSEFWLSVRNDPESRRNSRNHDLIPRESHERWFAAKLTYVGERLYIVEDSGKPAGYLRLSRDESGVELSYAVAPEFRGCGIGRYILQQAPSLSSEAFPDAILFGEVLPDNAASAHLFESCGYIMEESGACIKYVWRG